MFKKFVYVLAIAGVVFASAGLDASATTGNQLVSPGFEQFGVTWDNGYEEFLDGQSYNWHNYGSGYTRVAYLGRPNTGWYGARVVSASTSGTAGAYQRVDLNQTAIGPVFLGGYVKGENITMAPGSYFGASLYAEIHLKNGQVVYWNTPANAGTFDWKWIGFNTAQLGSLISAPIDYIFVVPSLIQASGTAYFDDFNVKEVVSTDANEGMMSDYVTPAPTPDPSPTIKPKGCILPFRWMCPR